MKNKGALELHKKSQDALMAGNTDEAKKHLKKLVENYPGTEEAEQAKVMLEGLP
jgi:outer membrane protein assembly factor BamD (BamD/ComL family)